MKTHSLLRSFLCFVLFFLIYNQAFTQTLSCPTTYPIKESLIKAQLRFLSSAWFEGRKTGEKGSDLAANLLPGMFHLNFRWFWQDTTSMIPLLRKTTLRG